MIAGARRSNDAADAYLPCTHRIFRGTLDTLSGEGEEEDVGKGVDDDTASFNMFLSHSTACMCVPLGSLNCTSRLCREEGDEDEEEEEEGVGVDMQERGGGQLVQSVYVI